MIITDFSLDIAGSEWFIIFIVIVIVFVPKKMSGISKTLGKFVGEYEKTKAKLINEKNNLTQQAENFHIYKGPNIQGPIASEREKLEIIAKSLDIQYEDKSVDELRNLISIKLKESQSRHY